MQSSTSNSFLFDREDVPGHLFSVPELDFSEDIFAPRWTSQWFRLGAWTEMGGGRVNKIEDATERFSLLLPVEDFSAIFENLESVGNVLRNLGKPTAWTSEMGQEKSYWYSAFHDFRIGSKSVEPLVFLRGTKSSAELFVNPDFWLFFELEELNPGNGIWWDPPKGVEVIRNHLVNGVRLVETRTEYLQRYLQARQLSLLIGQYRHLHLIDPPEDTIGRFVKEDVIIGSPERRAKAIFQNWGVRADCGSTRFLQRRLHLWYQLLPKPIDLDDPWAEDAPFDAFSFTLPTSVGPVAPGRWRAFRGNDEGTFNGTVCDFMDRVYFKQEVLSKYQGTAGFSIGDDGSVRCYNDWGLVRSNMRIGNELLSTAIGDFAEGVGFEEWQHWQQFAVEPPSDESYKVLVAEQTIQNAVNQVITALTHLNETYKEFSQCFGIDAPTDLWTGSIDSLAAKQLKWVYPISANDEEFLKRSTLLSTLVLEELKSKPLRKLLGKIDQRLPMNDEEPPRPLGSRNLLQRLVLLSVLIEEIQPNHSALGSLVFGAEGKESIDDGELRLEIQGLYKSVRNDMEGLAFLYDLRNAGGLAHSFNWQNAADAAVKLDLPAKGWRRKDYLKLLNLVTLCVEKVSEHFERAAIMMISQVRP